MSATKIYAYNEDPGLAALAGKGPAINVVREITDAINAQGGREVLGVVGALVNDRGQVNEATRLDPSTIPTYWGGFKSWMGDGLARASRGQVSAYNGNLAAQLDGVTVPILVVSCPDLACKDKSISDATAVDARVALTRSAAAGILRVPAGTRITKTDTGETYTVATLEDVTFEDGEGTGGSPTYKLVRVRQTSTPAALSGPAVIALNTLDTIVDAVPLLPSGVTVSVDATNTPAVTPIDTTAAEVALRYSKALAVFTSTIPGASASIMVTDRDEATISTALAAHCPTESARGFWRIGVVGAPKGTTAAIFQSSTSPGVLRTGLDRSRIAYTAPNYRRTFLADAVNLRAPQYGAHMLSAFLYAARIAQEPPHANPARPHLLFRQVGFLGVEALDPAPDEVDSWDVGVDQICMDADPETGGAEGTWFAGILANKVKIANQRFEDRIIRNSVRLVRPYHKAPAIPANRDAAAGVLFDYYSQLVADGLATGFVLAQAWDGDNEMLTFSVAIRTAGNADIITFRTRIGPGVELRAAA